MKNTDNDNRTVIDMLVKDDTEFLSKFSNKNSFVISSEVATFLENSVKNVKLKEDLKLRIYSDCIDDEEKVLYRQGVKDYYSDALNSVKREYKRNIMYSIILALVGIVLIAVALIVGSYGQELWTEAIDIVAWVFCWEAVDMFVFKSRSLRIDKLRFSALSNIVIEYYPLIQKD